MKIDLHSPHFLGQKAAKEHIKALDALSASIGLKGYHALFLSSGEEGIAQVFWTTYLHSIRALGKNHLLISKNAGRAIYANAERLEGLGALAKSFSDDLQELLSVRTALVSVEAANPVTGEMASLEDISALCKKQGALLHIDVTAALGRSWIDLEQLSPDYITYDGWAPGTGVLWVRENIPIKPLISGAEEQSGLRAGAVSPGICIETASEISERLIDLSTFSMEYAEKRAEFCKRLGGAQIFAPLHHLPHIVVFGFKGLHAELLAYHLNEAGIYLSLGGGRSQSVEQLTNNPSMVSIDLTEVDVDAVDTIVEVARSLKARVAL